MDAEATVYAPGSPTARSFGCTCDARKNRDGAGAGTTHGGKPLFVIEKRCPLHGEKKQKGAA